MYGIYAYIDPPNHPNVGIYSIHGVYGLDRSGCVLKYLDTPWDDTRHSMRLPGHSMGLQYMPALTPETIPMQSWSTWDRETSDLPGVPTHWKVRKRFDQSTQPRDAKGEMKGGSLSQKPSGERKVLTLLHGSRYACGIRTSSRRTTNYVQCSMVGASVRRGNCTLRFLESDFLECLGWPGRSPLRPLVPKTQTKCPRFLLYISGIPRIYSSSHPKSVPGMLATMLSSRNTRPLRVHPALASSPGLGEFN